MQKSMLVQVPFCPFLRTQFFFFISICLLSALNLTKASTLTTGLDLILVVVNIYDVQREKDKPKEKRCIGQISPHCHIRIVIPVHVQSTGN